MKLVKAIIKATRATVRGSTSSRGGAGDQAERDRISRAERDYGRPTRHSTPEERGDR